MSKTASRQQQSQSNSGGVSPRQSQLQDSAAATAAPSRVPGEDPGTLSDFEYVATGGPDAVDSASNEEHADAHPDSHPDTRRDQAEDPERPGGAEDRSQLL